MDKRVMCFTHDPQGRKLAHPEVDCEGPYFPMYRAWFKQGIKKAINFQSQKVCFSKLIFPAHISSNHIWHEFWENSKCKQTFNWRTRGSPLFAEYRGAVLSHFGLSDESNRIDKNKVVITYNIRHVKPFNTEPIRDRTATNRDAIIAMLKEFEAVEGLDVVVTTVDLATIPFREQVAFVHNTSVFVGFQAGLTQAMFMSTARPTALVELFPLGNIQRGCENIAVYSGVEYYFWRNKDSNKETKGGGTEVDIAAVREQVRLALESIKKRQQKI
eukprot:CAMPEP_0175169120 /NCGR_PEP_ID=MMETSP0087-20121206/29384_1 /TAXON_ID=136419 /ORGANISM="Unknown Unknown, Strain D1" /LENGTH=271 /DNA_ID=CAMNT_0016459411 /DNA_START=97 /DNA_END=912 /DNA_ORIENTATION=+